MRWITLAAAALALASAAPAAAQKAPAAKTFRDCPECPLMVVVPAGRFTMGSPATQAGHEPKEEPQLEVVVAKAFAAGTREVTRAQYEAFVRDSGHAPANKMNCGYRTTPKPGWKYDRADLDWRNPGFKQAKDHPVVCVTWNDAKAYVAWLSKKTKRTYRLLSDAEWEYVARAGTTTSRPWGDDPKLACKHANVADVSRDRALTPDAKPGPGTHACDDKYAYTSPGGQYAPNPFGLRDTIGNVWEWVEDCWNENLQGAPADGSARLSGDCKLRAVRGGSWIGPPAGGMRSAKRDEAPAEHSYINLGIRVAATP